MDSSELLVAMVALLLALFINDTSAEYCYNSYYREGFNCQYGCCGDYYDFDYGCCSVARIVVGAVFGAMVFIAVIVVLIYMCNKHKYRGRVINLPQHNTAVTVIQPPPYQPQGPVDAPPSYTGPPPGGSINHPGSQQPGMVPPPPQPHPVFPPPKF